MQRSTLNIAHWISGLLGLMAIGWLLLLPASSPETATAGREAYFSVVKSAQKSDQSDCFSARYAHTQKGLIRPQTAFSFVLPLACLSALLTVGSWNNWRQTQLLSVSCFFSFHFLRLVFEHQIAINAP